MNEHMMLDTVFMLDSEEKLNSEFSRVRIRIAYAGLNRNGSVIPKELFDRMAHTSLKNVPIVGHWIEKNDNFGGHDWEEIQSGNDVELRDMTRPFGVIPSDTDIWWETVREQDGFTTHEYLNCTGILWSGRYPECEKILRDGANQSMEIALRDWTYDEEGHLVVRDAEFSALCILGRDADPEKNVEPCFEKSCIEVYGLDEFKKAYFEMLDELKKYESAGAQDLGDAEDCGNTSETDEFSETSEQADADESDEAESCADREESTDAGEAAEFDDSEIAADSFESGDHAKSAESGDSGEFCENSADADSDHSGSESGTVADYVAQIANLSARYDELMGRLAEAAQNLENLQNAFDSYRETHSHENSEVDELIAFRRDVEAARHSAEIAEVLDDFADTLDGNAEFEKLRDAAESYSDTEELRRECYAILGRTVKPARSKSREQMAMKFDIRKDEKPEPYGGLFLAFNK